MFYKKIDTDLQKELLNIVSEWEVELSENNDKQREKNTNRKNDMNSLLITCNRKYKGRGYRGY